MYSAGNDEAFNAPAQKGQSIVKLRSGGDEPPLIVIHGGGGTIHAFAPLKNGFSTAIWAIQVTPDTPMETLNDQAMFYFYRIKELRPNGPYRIAAFSASSLIAFAVAKAMEANGDRVTQLFLIDHFPTTFLAPLVGIDTSQTSLSAPNAREEFLDASYSNLIAMTRRDGGGNVPKRLKFADELSDARKGQSDNQIAVLFKETLDRFLNQIFDFLLHLETESQLPVLSALEDWLKVLKAPVTIFVGSYGMAGSIPAEHREEWHDLGTRRCFPNAHIVFVDAGHYDILGNHVVIAGLQSGYDHFLRHRL